MVFNVLTRFGNEGHYHKYTKANAVATVVCVCVCVCVCVWYLLITVGCWNAMSGHIAGLAGSNPVDSKGGGLVPEVELLLCVCVCVCVHMRARVWVGGGPSYNHTV